MALATNQFQHTFSVSVNQRKLEARIREKYVFIVKNHLIIRKSSTVCSITYVSIQLFLYSFDIVLTYLGRFVLFSLKNKYTGFYVSTYFFALPSLVWYCRRKMLCMINSLNIDHASKNVNLKYS